MEGQKKEKLSEVGEFISEYSAHMMGCGVHTSRVIRSAKRIGEAFGYSVKISVFQRNIILTVVDERTHEHHNEVTDIPGLPISFEQNSRLSALSWETYDNHLSLSDLRSKYQHHRTARGHSGGAQHEQAVAQDVLGRSRCDAHINHICKHGGNQQRSRVFNQQNKKGEGNKPFVRFEETHKRFHIYPSFVIEFLPELLL